MISPSRRHATEHRAPPLEQMSTRLPIGFLRTLATWQEPLIIEPIRLLCKMFLPPGRPTERGQGSGVRRQCPAPNVIGPALAGRGRQRKRPGIRRQGTGDTRRSPFATCHLPPDLVIGQRSFAIGAVCRCWDRPQLRRVGRVTAGRRRSPLGLRSSVSCLRSVCLTAPTAGSGET